MSKVLSSIGTMDYGDWGHRDTATIKCVHSPKYVTQLLLPPPIYTLTHPHFLCPASHHAWTRGVGNYYSLLYLLDFILFYLDPIFAVDSSRGVVRPRCSLDADN